MGKGRRPLRLVWRAVTGIGLAASLLAALLVAAVLLSLFPRAPAEAVARQAWLVEAAARYGRAAPLLGALGLFTPYRAPWLLALLAALLLNGLACTAQRAPRVWRAFISKESVSVIGHLAALTLVAAVAAHPLATRQETGEPLSPGTFAVAVGAAAVLIVAAIVCLWLPCGRIGWRGAAEAARKAQKATSQRGGPVESMVTWLAAGAAVALAGLLAGRGLRAGHWPSSSPYEFALAFALAVTLAAVVAGRAAERRGRGVVTIQVMALGLAAALVACGHLGLPPSRRAIQPLPAELRTVWFPLHVSAAALAFGALALAGTAGATWLVRQAERPEAEWVRDRAVAVGYPLLTLSMLLGMVWGQAAWGRTWSWDLKELWTLIVWLIGTLYWHLQHRPAWKGRRLAWLALIGLAAVLFTFLGVGWLAASVEGPK